LTFFSPFFFPLPLLRLRRFRRFQEPRCACVRVLPALPQPT
jgi:hypothetical protein